MFYVYTIIDGKKFYLTEKNGLSREICLAEKLKTKKELELRKTLYVLNNSIQDFLNDLGRDDDFLVFLNAIEEGRKSLKVEQNGDDEDETDSGV